MARMLISFSGPQEEWIRQQAQELDIGVSELVRRIIDAERERVEDRQRMHCASMTHGFTTTTTH